MKKSKIEKTNRPPNRSTIPRRLEGNSSMSQNGGVKTAWEDNHL